MMGCFCCSAFETTDDGAKPRNTTAETPEDKRPGSIKQKEIEQFAELRSKIPSFSAQSSKWTKTAQSTTHAYPNTTESSHNDTESSHSRGFWIENRFEVLQAIGQGSFGTVYHGKDVQTGTFVAVKILKQKGHQSYYRETNVLTHLIGVEGVPRIFWKGRIANRDILIVNRMGCDLSMLFEYCNHKFSLGTTLKIGIEMMKLIRGVHEKGILHRDIKPHNFLVGYKSDRSKLFIIDFGLAKSYLTTSENKHKRLVQNLMPVGTARYASVWTHRGMSQSRRDDLESIGFVLIYFLKSKLPWQGLKIHSKHEKWRKIYAVKAGTKLDNLCAGLPIQFTQYLQYVRSLKYSEDPKYCHLIELFQLAAEQQNINLDNVHWDWHKIPNIEDA